jgi:hypothetical protein
MKNPTHGDHLDSMGSNDPNRQDHEAGLAKPVSSRSCRTQVSKSDLLFCYNYHENPSVSTVLSLPSIKESTPDNETSKDAIAADCSPASSRIDRLTKTTGEKQHIYLDPAY